MKKIALLGAAHIHTPDFVRRLLARDDLIVVGVWDHDTDRAHSNSKKLGCHICSSVDELLKLDALDAVIATVSTPATVVTPVPDAVFNVMFCVSALPATADEV